MKNDVKLNQTHVLTAIYNL